MFVSSYVAGEPPRKRNKTTAADVDPIEKVSSYSPISSITDLDLQMFTARPRLLWTADCDTQSGRKQASVLAEADDSHVPRIVQIQGGKFRGRAQASEDGILFVTLIYVFPVDV